MQPAVPTPVPAPDSRFEHAAQLYHSGQLAGAESLLRQILAEHPNHISAWQSLGALLMQQHRVADAADVYQKYVVVDPNSADAHYNLGVAYAMLGEFGPATESFTIVTRIRPDWAAAFSNLGNALSGANRTEESEHAYRRAIALEPGFAGAWGNLGGLLLRSGKYDAAITALNESIRLRPDHPETLYNLAHALKSAGCVDEAIAQLQHVIRLRPDYYEAWQAIATFQGLALQFDQAITSAHRCVALEPNNPGSYNTLGLLLREQGKREEALREFQRALVLDPNYLQGYVNSGMMLHEQGRLAEAVAMQRAAVRLHPKSVEAQLNLGNALKDAGELDEALDVYRRVARIGPPSTCHHLLLALHSFPGLNPIDILAEHRRWTAAIGPVNPITPPNDFDPNRRLRVGFVSADFRRHAVGYNLLPLFDRLDRGSLEFFIYNNSTHNDDLTDYFRRQVDRWTQISALTDEQASQKIAADRIDILIDLSLHSGGGRLEIFPYKPAPLAGTFAGYPSTTGLSQIDFRLSDPYLDPPGETEQFYTERTIRLKQSFWCFRPADVAPAVNPLPALTNGFVTIGYLGSFVKVNRPTLSALGAGAAAGAESRLLMICRPGVHRDHMRRHSWNRKGSLRIELSSSTTSRA